MPQNATQFLDEETQAPSAASFLDELSPLASEFLDAPSEPTPFIEGVSEVRRATAPFPLDRERLPTPMESIAETIGEALHSRYPTGRFAVAPPAALPQPRDASPETSRWAGRAQGVTDFISGLPQGVIDQVVLLAKVGPWSDPQTRLDAILNFISSNVSTGLRAKSEPDQFERGRAEGQLGAMAASAVIPFAREGIGRIGSALPAARARVIEEPPPVQPEAVPDTGVPGAAETVAPTTESATQPLKSFDQIPEDFVQPAAEEAMAPVEPTKQIVNVRDQSGAIRDVEFTQQPSGEWRTDEDVRGLPLYRSMGEDAMQAALGRSAQIAAEPAPSMSASEFLDAADEVSGFAPRQERPLTEEEIAQREHEAETLRQAQEDIRAQGGMTLKEAVEQAGGFPVLGTKGQEGYIGELKMLRETIRGTKGTSFKQAFSADSPGVDQLLLRLRARGFNIETPHELIDRYTSGARTGKWDIGLPEAEQALAGTQWSEAALASPKRKPIPPPVQELFGAQETPFNLRGEELTNEVSDEGERRAVTEAQYEQEKTQGQLFELENQARTVIREFQGDEYGGSVLPRTETGGAPSPATETGKSAIQDIARRAEARQIRVQQNRETLAKAIEARNTEEEFAAQGVNAIAQTYGRKLLEDYAEAIRSGDLPKQPRYPIYRGDFTHRPYQYITAADHALSVVQEAMRESGFTPKEDIYFSPKGTTVASPVPATVTPPPPRGQVLSMGDLPVTLARTAPGTVSASSVMDALKSVMRTAGSVGEIRSQRFMTRVAKGIFKPSPEVVRLEHINDVPTAVHETGHALMKQLYGTVKSRGLSGLPPAVKRELIGLGKGLYGDRRPNAGYTAEGFSEFLRYYLTRDDAKMVAPATHDFFVNQVLKDHPEVARALQGSRQLIDIYRTQGAMARANTQLVREPGWTHRVTQALRHFVSAQGQAESGLPLRELSREAAARLGKAIPPSADPYKLFKMKRGSAGPIMEAMVERNMVDPWGNPTGPSLREALAEVKDRPKEFPLYLFARRAEERWSKGINPGISLEDAQYIRQTLESPKFDRAAGKYYQWWDGVLNYLVKADPQMADVVSRIKRGSSDYAPLARMIDEGAARREAALSQSNPLYRMHGSGLPVKDIMEQTIAGGTRLVARANRRLVTNAIFKLSQIEGMGRLIEEVPRSMVQRRFNIEQIRADLENLGIDTTALPDDTILDYWTPAEQPKGSDPIISNKGADGVTRWYYVAPKIYDILDKIEPFSLRSIPHIGGLLDLVIGAPKRLFTLGTTGLRPTFSLITNPLRDPQGWLLQTKSGINPAKMAAAYFNALREQLQGAITGREGPFSNAALNLGPQMAQPLGRDIGYTRHAAKGLFHGRFMRVVRNPIDHLRQILNMPEAFPRLAEFQRVAQDVGWKPGEPISPDQAVQLALAYKEATVDFSAAGDASRIINEAVPFYNPNIQGIRTAVRAMREHPLRTTLWGLGTFTGPAVYLWWKNKDKDWYRNLPWRERYYYTNIDDGKNVWQIPRPFEWSNLFQVLPEAALDSWYRRDPRAVTEAIGHIFQTQNPFDYPVILRVAKEQWSNNVDFWDRPIVPKSEMDLPPSAQIGPYTTKPALWLGKAFPQLSPRRIDAAVRGFLGGAVPDVLDTLGLGAQKTDRESEAADIPVIGRLWRRGGLYNAQSQYLADFWDINQRLQAKAQANSMQLNNPSRVQTVSPNDSDLLFAPMFDSEAKNITFTLRLVNEMRKSKARQDLYREVAQDARQMLDLYNASSKSK